MAASSADKFTQTKGSAGNPSVTTVSAARASGGTSLSATALTNWPTDTQVHFITYTKNADGTKNNASQLDWKGTVSSSTSITAMVLRNGTDSAGNAIDDYIEMGPTGAWGEDLYDGLTKEHDSTGAHDSSKVAMLAGTQTFTGDKTFTGTVTVPDSTIDTAALADSAVTYTKLLSTIFSSQIVTGTNAGTAGGSTNLLNLGGVKLAWGVTNALSLSASAQATGTLTFPTTFAASPIVLVAKSGGTSSTYMTVACNSAAPTTTGVTLELTATTGTTTGTAKIMWVAIGT